MKNWFIKSNKWFDSLTGLKELYKILFAMVIMIPIFFGCYVLTLSLVTLFVFWRMSPIFIELYNILKERRNNEN